MARGGVKRASLGEPADCETHKDGIFNFFALPRELRDKIYEESLQFKKKFEPQHGVRLRARRIVAVELLLVNRQFHNEYLERAEKKTCLIIVDRDHYHGETLELPIPIKYARKLELHLALACDEPDHGMERCRMLPELRMHRKWIVKLSEQMKYLDAITIKVLIDAHACVKECEEKLLKEQYRLTNLESLASLEVYHCDYYVGKTSSAWNFGKPRKLVMKWSAESGDLQRVNNETTEAGEAKEAAKTKS